MNLLHLVDSGPRIADFLDRMLPPDLTWQTTEPDGTGVRRPFPPPLRIAAAVVGVTWDSDGKVRLVTHRIFQPSPDDPLDFEATVEATLKELAERFDVQVVRFDPYQLVSSAQRLERTGLPMEEYPQTLDRLTEMSSNLYELLKSTKVRAYPDRDIRLAMTRAVAVESARGWRIAKAKTAHKIDVVVALAMAALACVKECAGGDGPWLVYIGGQILDLRSGEVVKSSLNW